MDTSRGAANSAVLNKLRRAGTIGLHIDDIIKLLGFEEKRQIVPRLYALQNDGLIEKLNGQIWRIVETPPENGVAAAAPPLWIQNAQLPLANYQTQNNEIQNQQTQNYQAPNHQIHNYQLGTAPCKGTKNAAGPSTQFISYKNWLQEHCQKHHLPVPSYKTERGPEFGFIGFVSFDSNQMKSSVPMPTAKEAEQRVAFEALKNAQVLPNHAEFNVPLTAMNPAKKPKLLYPPRVPQPISATFAKFDGTKFDLAKSYKSLLNEYAQKLRITQPTYESILHSEGFISTVILNGQKYNSLQPMSQKRQAEQSAAYAALQQLNQIPAQANRIQQMQMPENATVGRVPTVQNQPLHPGTQQRQPTTLYTSAGYKNRLQEYFMKRQKELPKYDTIKKRMSGFDAFESKVTVNGRTWSSGDQRSKKNAEQEAARLALESLGLLNP